MDLQGPFLNDAWTAAIRQCVDQTRAQFEAGRALCDAVGGRLRYERRLTWLSGTRILERVEHAGPALPSQRPTIGTATCRVCSGVPRGGRRRRTRSARGEPLAPSSQPRSRLGSPASVMRRLLGSTRDFRRTGCSSMTLSPVFRSDEAVQILRTAGVWSRLDPAARGQAEAISRVKQDLPQILDAKYVDIGRLVEDPEETIGIEFVQEFFFLILFRSVLQTVGVTTADLRLCCELNFCIKGTITAADNLFDDQDKALLPLKLGPGFAISIDPPAARVRAAGEPRARARRERRLHFHRVGRSIPEGTAFPDGRDRFPGRQRGRRRRGRDGARPDDRTGPPRPRRRAVRAGLHRAPPAGDVGRSGCCCHARRARSPSWAPRSRSSTISRTSSST